MTIGLLGWVEITITYAISPITRINESPVEMRSGRISAILFATFLPMKYSIAILLYCLMLVTVTAPVNTCWVIMTGQDRTFRPSCSAKKQTFSYTVM